MIARNVVKVIIISENIERHMPKYVHSTLIFYIIAFIVKHVHALNSQAAWTMATWL